MYQLIYYKIEDSSTFVFYEPVYYRAHEPGFPSENRESSGRFMGIAENVGHALTYKILNEDNEKIIF